MGLSIQFADLIFYAALIGTVLISAGCMSSQPSDISCELSPSDNLTFYTEQLPPYNYQENGTLQGFTVDLLEAITIKAGIEMHREKVHVVPWEEGYQAALSGNRTVIFSMARIPTRENAFKWAGPISIERYVLFANQDSEVTITNPEELMKLRIGVIMGDASIQQLLDLGVDKNQFVTETNVSALITKLKNKEIDLWCYPEFSGRYYAEQVTGNYYAFKVIFPLEEVGIYYAFSRDIPDSTVQSFQKALDALKQEKDEKGVSMYDRIQGRYIPSIGLAHLQYLTEEWAPFNYLKEGIPTGIAVENLEAVFRTIGVNLTRKDVRVVPLSEGFRQAQGNNSTVLFSIVRSPDRESLYQWAGPFTKGKFVIFAPVSRKITIRTPADLNQYHIGAVKDTIENTLLTSQGVIPHRLFPD